MAKDNDIPVYVTNDELDAFIWSLDFDGYPYIAFMRDEVTLDGSFTYQQILELAEKVKQIQDKIKELGL